MTLIQESYKSNLFNNKKEAALQPFSVMIIRKISIGSDYKTSMHYITGQDVLSGTSKIHLIEFDLKSRTYKIYIEKGQEIYLWKEFSPTIPVSVEYNINF